MINLWRNGWHRYAKAIRSPNFNQRPSNAFIELLVIHCISLPCGQYDNEHVERLFQNRLDVYNDATFATLKDLRVSAHFYIKRNGQLIQFVSALDRAWHAGQSRFLDKTGCNDFSIGVELQGDEYTPFTPMQYEQLIQLTRDLFVIFPRLKKDRIVGHQDIAPERKTDPGEYFDWAFYKGSL